MDEQTAAEQQTDRTKRALDPRQRRIAWIALRVLGAAIVLSLIMATILTRSWTPFYLALAVGIPYIILLSAPVWLARMAGRDDQTHNTND
jgi:Sec-independent protein secretion pathway component TatC